MRNTQTSPPIAGGTPTSDPPLIPSAQEGQLSIASRFPAFDACALPLNALISPMADRRLSPWP
jgi:hypothetical protein